MRVLLSVVGTRGDVQPVLALALEVRALGHEVHHGGAGTTLAAARAGAPQVVVPMFSDQPFWARRVTELGIGTSLPFAALSAEGLSSALRDALEPALRNVRAGSPGRSASTGLQALRAGWSRRADPRASKHRRAEPPAVTTLTTAAHPCAQACARATVESPCARFGLTFGPTSGPRKAATGVRSK